LNQQYVLLKKPNDSLNSLIGQSFNQKSKFEANKILKEIHKQADQHSMEKALCYIVDKGEIKGVGGSSLIQNKKTGEIVSDLILDQFGVVLTALFRRDNTVDKSVNILDVNGASKNLFIYSASGSAIFTNNALSNKGCLVRVGSGTTTPARTDFKIAIPFATPPESNFFNATSDPIYNLGLSNMKYVASITAGGTGTINESVFASDWRQNSPSGDFIFALFRDIISPAQSFIIGQSIALEYTVQL